MTQRKKPLPLFIPILATVVALGDFAACFFMVRASAPVHPFEVMLLAEILLIAGAIGQWMLYLQGYILRQIEERLQADS